MGFLAPEAIPAVAFAPRLAASRPCRVDPVLGCFRAASGLDYHYTHAGRATCKEAACTVRFDKDFHFLFSK